MSQNVYEDEEGLFDPWANPGGGNYAPVISWKYSRPGDSFEGIVVPAEPIKRPDQGYKMMREYQDGTDANPNDKGLLVWPPKNNVQGIDRPVTEGAFARTWPEHDLSKAGKVWRTNITFLTDYTSGELLSDNWKARTTDAGEDPNAERTRRVILSGPDLPGKVKEALKTAGRKPLPGQRWKIVLDKREENVGRKGTTIRYSVTITPPTDSTLKVVADYVAAKQAEANQTADAANPDDPWAGTAVAGSALREEPPF